MGKGLVSDTNLTAIANAIRTKNGSSDRYTPSTMAQAISDIPTSQVDQTTALQYMLNNKTNYAGIAAGLTTLTTLPTFTQPANVKDFRYAFSGCSNITDAALSAVDFSKAVNCSGAFYGCKSLTAIPNVPLNSIVSMDSMFSGCTGLTGAISISGGSNSNSDRRTNMFYGCTGITSVTLTGTTFYGVTALDGMFWGCNHLETFNAGATNTTVPYQDLTRFFRGCSRLSSFKNIAVDGLVVSYYETFRDCSSLTTIPLMVSGCMSLQGVCQNCASLTTLQITGSAATCRTFVSAFSGCTSLTAIPAMDTSSAIRFTTMCYGCSSLTTFPVLDFSAIAKTTNGLQNMVAGCPLLSNESLNNIMASIVAGDVRYNKNLKYIGLSSAQATTCTTLSNWPALSAKGWTTGY